jgi:hypothetical protein
MEKEGRISNEMDGTFGNNVCKPTSENASSM